MSSGNEPAQIGYIREACARLGWSVQVLDPFSHYMVRISDGSRSFLSGAGPITSYPGNGATAASIARDKSFTADLLAQAGFTVPEGKLFFLSDLFRDTRPGGRERADIPPYAESLGWPVIAKPNDGSRGNLVEMLFDPEELGSYLERAARQTNSVLVQRPLALPEYRIFTLDGEIRYLYRRERGGLRGDGHATIGQLLATHNRAATGTGLSEVPATSRFLRHHLEQAGLGLDDVLPRDKVLPCAPNANISGGGQIRDFSLSASQAARDWARRLHAALPLSVMGIDVFAADILDPATFVVCEVNSNPSVKGLEDIGQRETIIALWMDICRMGLELAS